MRACKFQADIWSTVSVQSAYFSTPSCGWPWVISDWRLPAPIGSYWFARFSPALGPGPVLWGARYIHHALAGPRLHLAQGFFGGSTQLGGGFVILAVPRLNLVAGWRVTFLVSAGMALAAAIIWLAAAPSISS